MSDSSSADDHMSSIHPRWLVLDNSDVKIRSTKEPIVVGMIGLGPEKIPTYSCSETSNHNGERLPNFCQGAFTIGGRSMCPAGAPRIPNIIYIIKGKLTPLCGTCALVESTPAAIRDRIVGMDDDFNVKDIVSPLYELEKFQVRDTILPGFIGDKRLAIIMEKKGLCAGFAAALQDDNGENVGRIYQELQDLGTTVTEGESIKPSIFTEILKRNVLITDKSDWWSSVKGIIEYGVPALKQYFDCFFPEHNDGVATMVNGWLSYYLRESVVNLDGIVGAFGWHRDAGLTPDGQVDCRLVLTILNHADGSVHKRMYFVDRKTGCWFSFKCGHGYAVSMSQIVSGFRDGRFMHKIEGAEGTYAQVIQVSPSILIFHGRCSLYSYCFALYLFSISSFLEENQW